MTILGYLSTAQAAAHLSLTRQRIHQLARAYGWDRHEIGGIVLWVERDVDIHAQRMEAQKAWRLLGIPPSQWAWAELADVNDFETFECPECGELAYSPAPGCKWIGAACPSCEWTEKS